MPAEIEAELKVGTDAKRETNELPRRSLKLVLQKQKTSADITCQRRLLSGADRTAIELFVEGLLSLNASTRRQLDGGES